MIDHEEVDRALAGFELEAELALQGAENAGRGGGWGRRHCSRMAPAGTLAMMSKRSESSLTRPGSPLPGMAAGLMEATSNSGLESGKTGPLLFECVGGARRFDWDVRLGIGNPFLTFSDNRLRIVDDRGIACRNHRICCKARWIS